MYTLCVFAQLAISQTEIFKRPRRHDNVDCAVRRYVSAMDVLRFRNLSKFFRRMQSH